MWASPATGLQGRQAAMHMARRRSMDAQPPTSLFTAGCAFYPPLLIAHPL